MRGTSDPENPVLYVAFHAAAEPNEPAIVEKKKKSLEMLE